MNYCDKIKYNIYTTIEDSFENMVDDLLSQASTVEYPLRLAFFGTPADNNQYIKRRDLLSQKVLELYGEREPVLSYVSQPPLNAGLILEVHSLEAEDDDALFYRKHENFPYVLLENKDGRFLFAGGFHGDVLNSSILNQSEEIFKKIYELLKKEEFPIENIIRQWNYIERITAYDGKDQHYQMFNNARSSFYSKTKWINGYPAATGIGTNLGGVLVDFDAAVFKNKECYSTPIDNKLQVAAHAYSDQVLELANKQKTTPKFERAKSMTFKERDLIYISGTAAIRGEESLTNVGLSRQLQITMENIAQLIGKAEIEMLRVYLKDKSFYQEAKRGLNEYSLNIPISYMWADVCRDELLIEIEGIAIR